MQIEEPFAILPLEQHQRWLLRDARQAQQTGGGGGGGEGGGGRRSQPWYAPRSQVKARFAHLTGSGVRAPAQPPAGGGVAEGRVAGEGAEAVEGAARGSPSQSRQAN